MQAVILIAGYGSRLKRDDIPHKCLLPFGDDTLLSRHLFTLQQAGIEKAILVAGHNRDAVKDYVGTLDLQMPVEFVDNPDYRTTGNNLSLMLGVRGRKGDLLVMDGDVLYPRTVLEAYLKQSAPSSFAVVPVDIDDTEATKVLLRSDGHIHSFVTKRDLTDEEKQKYKVAGEAIGFFQLSEPVVQQLIQAYQNAEQELIGKLWEFLFNKITAETAIGWWPISDTRCIEIDTQEDYESALQQFEGFDKSD